MDELVSVSRYRIEKIIGKGAMGIVYLAFDAQIERRVALKTIRVVEDARPDEVAVTRERFLREAKAAGQLLHPNIVTVFDVFEDRDTLYIVMEYVEGRLLDDFCIKSNLLPPDEAVQLAMQGLSALGFAHHHGIVHRDIKPANLMVVDDGNILKVMDFGVARQEGAHLTQTGFIVGTPHYMSPEQIEGKELDGRSDVFSMGVVLYELLTGERPFTGDTISTVIYHIINHEPAPVTTIMPTLPRGVNSVLAKALAKNPARRYFSAEAFKQDLGRLLTKEATDISPAFEEKTAKAVDEDAFLPPPIRSSKKNPRRRSNLRVSLLVIIGGALIVLSWFLSPRIQQLVDSVHQSRPLASPSHEKLPMPVTITTDPPGAKLFLDGKAVDAVTLKAGDTGSHVVEARLGCLSAKATIRRNDAGRPLHLKLLPGPFAFKVDSVPDGASIKVNGAKTGMVTPAVLDRNDCSSFRLSLSLAGRETQELSFNPGIKPGMKDAVTVNLRKIPPKGTLRVVFSSGKLKVYEGSLLLGYSGQALNLPAGKHELRVVDRFLRGSRSVKVVVQAGKTVRLPLPAFRTGRVFLYGKPANDGKVSVDGRFFEELPLNGMHPIAVGRHRFRVSGEGGKTVDFEWTVRSGNQTRVVDLQSGKVEKP